MIIHISINGCIKYTNSTDLEYNIWGLGAGELSPASGPWTKRVCVIKLGKGLWSK